MHCLNSKTHDKKRKQYISYQKKVFVEFLEILNLQNHLHIRFGPS